MKNRLKIFFPLILIVTILLSSCSELRDDISSAPQLNIHKEGISNPQSPNFHAAILKNINWNLKNCAECHASDFSGGITGASCLTCHNTPNGPKECNLCHGDQNDPSMIAPPEDLDGNTQTTAVGVGAHRIHLYENDLGADIQCSSCHRVPQNFFDAGHIDESLPADVLFGNTAIINAGSTSMYDYSSATCSNTYCHGNFVFYRDSSTIPPLYVDSIMVGNNVSVVWNLVDGSQTQCGSCHGLPPTGHAPEQIQNCVVCHSGVVDNQGNIVDRTKHINGIVNIFGN